jgi:hypothetical protein
MKRLLILSLLILGITKVFGQGWGALSSYQFPIPDVRLGDSFGSSISVDGDYALVGAPYYDVDGLDAAGKAFLLEKQGDKWVIIHEIDNPEPKRGSQFGHTVLLTGKQAFIGAPSPLNLDNEGKVFVYQPNNGSWKDNISYGFLFFQNPEAGNRFGTSIAVMGDIAAIGAPGASGTSGRRGAVYLFQGLQGPGIEFMQKVVPSSADLLNFGHSVATNDKYLFVTAPVYDESYQTPGAAFVFDSESNFSQIAKIDPPPGNTHFFGFGSAASSDTYVISSFTRSENGGFGAVHLYSEGAGWANGSEPTVSYLPTVVENNYSLYGTALLLTENRLFIGHERQHVEIFSKGDEWLATTPSVVIKEPGLDGSGIGTSIGYNGSDILVGDQGYEKLGVSSGIVYAYTAAENPVKYCEVYQGTISADFENFGSDVHVYKDFAIVAAVNDNSNGASSGSAYIYHFNGTEWERLAKITPSDGGPDHYFGTSVSITEERAVVSAARADFDDYRSGKVYVFEKPATGWKDMNETSTIMRVNNEVGQFGNQIAAHGDEIIVTQFESNQSFGVGYGYVFKKEGATWVLKSELSPSQRTDEFAALFGFSLAYDGATIAIGSHRAASAKGAVFVFAKPPAGWDAQQTENARLTTSGGSFSVGHSVDVLDNTIISGGFGGSQNGTTGAAYIFEKGDAWQNTTETAKLVGYANSGVTIGYDVSLVYDFALVSGTSPLVGEHSIYLFKKSNGQWKNGSPYNHENTSSKPGERGLRIAAFEDHLIVGAEKYSSSAGKESGVAEFRRKSPTVKAVTSSTPDGKYKEGDIIDIQVTFTQPISLQGTPAGLSLVMHDNTTRTASYVDFTESLTLNFRYVVAGNDSTPRLNYESETSLLGQFTPRSAKEGYFGHKELPHPDSKYALAGKHKILIDGDYVEPEVPVGVSDDQEELSVYPNPFEGRFVVQGAVKNLMLIDSTGKEVYRSSAPEYEINGSSLAPGLYFLRVNMSSGVKTFKIVKR